MTNVVPRLIQASTDLQSMHETLDTAARHLGNAADLLHAAVPIPVAATADHRDVPQVVASSVQGALALARAELATVTSELGSTHLTGRSDAVVGATQGEALLRHALDRAADPSHLDIGSLATDLAAVSRRLADAGVTARADGGAVDQALRVLTGAGRPLPGKVTVGDLHSIAATYLPLATGTRRVITTVTAMDDIAASMAPRTQASPGPYQPAEEFERRGMLALDTEARAGLGDLERTAAHLPDGSLVGRFLEHADATLGAAFQPDPDEIGPAPQLPEGGVLLDASAVRDQLDVAGNQLEQGVQQAVAERRALLAAATYGSTRVDPAS